MPKGAIYRFIYIFGTCDRVFLKVGSSSSFANSARSNDKQRLKNGLSKHLQIFEKKPGYDKRTLQFTMY